MNAESPYPMPENPEWTIRASEIEYDTGWYRGGYDLVEQPDGTTKRYYWAELPPAVIIVAQDGGDVLFVEQYRPAIREAHLELPAGIIESDETAPQAAARELAEETGYVPEECSTLATYWVATGVLRHRRAVVVAEGLTETERTLDPNEFLTVRRIPTERAPAVALESPANDATIEGVLLAERYGYLMDD